MAAMPKTTCAVMTTTDRQYVTYVSSRIALYTTDIPKDIGIKKRYQTDCIEFIGSKNGIHASMRTPHCLHQEFADLNHCLVSIATNRATLQNS